MKRKFLYIAVILAILLAEVGCTRKKNRNRDRNDRPRNRQDNNNEEDEERFGRAFGWIFKRIYLEKKDEGKAERREKPDRGIRAFGNIQT